MCKSITWISMVVAGSLSVGGCVTGPSRQDSPVRNMSFFVISMGPGNGGDLGGIEGADRHCQKLAAAAGAGDRTWRAYLSTQGSKLNDANVVHARDRIGSGPWYNAKGVMIARNVEELHGAGNNVTKLTALDEQGRIIDGAGDKPNRHDILTGSRPDGTALAPAPFPDMTCGNWTKNGAGGSAMTGHHDRVGPIDHAWAMSWNSTHPTLGCTQDAFRKTGGDGLFYCFAVKSHRYGVAAP